MEIRILGPLEVVEAGRIITIASERQRALLALLALHAGRAVTTDSILDALWGDRPPESGAGSVAFHVSRLRAALEPARRETGDASTLPLIATEAGGYSLRIAPEAIDATGFERLGREAREHLDDDPAATSARLREALELWRGEPFADLADFAFLQPEIARLRELRLRMLEDRAEAELALGHARDAAGELESLVGEEPLREHLRALLMRALYAAGRQADALRTYQEGRRLLADELGIDPSSELQSLEVAILRQDAALDVSRATVGGPRNPYKGLRPFAEADAPDFFGREALVDRLVERLEAVARAGGLLLVVGPSGIGKSSVVRAGLVPRLRSREAAGGEPWAIATMLPGARPEEALARALEAVGVGAPAPGTASTDDAGAIAAALRRAAASADRPLVLVIDQFEELFALATDHEAPTRFLAGLAQALTGPAPRPVVVAALRADWFDRPLLSAELGALVRGGTEIVAPLSRDELERAIVRPATAVGVDLEPGLATQLVADVADRPGALPLLQFALTELFERAGGRTITRESYAAIGGVGGAIGRRAEAVFDELDDPSQSLARRLFLRQVAVGEGRPAIARRVPVDDLRSLDPEPERVDAVLEAFARPRLLAFDRDPRTGRATVEPAHEALLTHWARLAGWVREAQDALWIEARLKDAAADWESAGRDPGFLLTGSRLEVFSEWAATADIGLDAAERGFLEASAAERDRAAAAERTRLDREQRLERRARTWLRGLVAVFALAAVLSTSLLALVWQQSEAAATERALATARELAVASDGTLDSDPALALLLAVESARATADRGWITEESMDALHQAIQAARVPYPSAESPTAIRASTAGRYGVYLLPPAELVSLAGHSAGRPLAADECQTYLHSAGCPSPDDGFPDSSLAVRSGGKPVPLDALAAPSLAGTRVRVASQLPADLESILPGFTQSTGISIEVVSADDRAALTDTADLAILVRPDDMATLATAGVLFDLDELLDPAMRRDDVPTALADAGWSGPQGLGPDDPDARRYGFPVAVSLSGLLWYPKAAFRDADYEPPRTWADLEALASALRANGQAPWCLGLQDAAGREDLADWVEDLVLGSTTRDVYEEWANVRVSFDGDPTAGAVRALDSLVAVEGAVPRGLASAYRTPHVLLGPSMVAHSGPDCWLQHGAATLPAAWPTAARNELAAVPMPPTDSARPGVLRGRVYTAVALRDRPEIRALLEFLVGGTADEAIATRGSAGGLLPVGEVDPSILADDAIRAQLALFRDALPDRFALDATDRMPAALGVEALPDGLAAYLSSGSGEQRGEALDALLGALERVRGSLP